MKKFFENYGFVALAAIVVISLISIAKPVGGGIQSATTSIVGSFQNRVLSSTSEINNHNRISSNTIIKIEGDEYVVLDYKLDNKYLVMKIKSVTKMPFNTSETNGQNNAICYSNSEFDYNHSGCSNIYENSSIDQYLNQTYYESLPFKDAIVETEIKQTFYKKDKSNTKFRWNDDLKTMEVFANGSWINAYNYTPNKGEYGAFTFAKKGYANNKNEQSQNIKRFVFLPSVDEVSKIANLNDQSDVYQLTRSGKNSDEEAAFSLRDADWLSQNSLTIHNRALSVHGGFLTNDWMGTQPAFVIDLSKVEYINTNDQFIK